MAWELLALLEGHENEVKGVAWSGDGRYLATCSRDKSVWVWESLADGDFECVSVLHGHAADVKSVRFRPGGDELFSCSYDDSIRVWADDGDDWEPRATLQGHSSTVWSVAFAGDDLFASASADGSVAVWRSVALKGKENWLRVAQMSDAHEREVYSVDCGAHGLLASGGADDRVVVYRAEGSGDDLSYSVIAARTAHAGDVNAVRWGRAPPVAHLLATAGDDGLVRLWTLRE